MDWKLGAVAISLAVACMPASAQTRYRCIDHLGKPKAHWTLGECPDPAEIAEERAVTPRTAADPCGRRNRDAEFMRACAKAIQTELRGEYLWGSNLSTERFPERSCVDGTDDVARYAGDKVFETTFNRRYPRTYECRIDTDTALIIEVKLGYPAR